MIESFQAYAPKGDGFKLYTKDVCQHCGRTVYDPGVTVWLPEAQLKNARKPLELIDPANVNIGGIYPTPSGEDYRCEICL